MFLIYEIYIAYRYVWYLIRWESYGNVYKDIMIIPHFTLLLIGIIFHFIYFLKQKIWIRNIIIGCYILGSVFLFL